MSPINGKKRKNGKTNSHFVHIFLVVPRFTKTKKKVAKHILSLCKYKLLFRISQKIYTVGRALSSVVCIGLTQCTGFNGISGIKALNLMKTRLIYVFISHL